jgi:DivIVA domain-containing protein
MVNDIVLVLAALAVIVAASLIASGRWNAIDGESVDMTQDLPDEAITLTHLETLRLAVTIRGYRMDEVDVVLDRVTRAIRQRDARIAELEQQLDNEPVLNMDPRE